MLIKPFQFLRIFATAIAGAILPLAFPPINLFMVAWISPIILMLLIYQQTSKLSFLLGWIFGLGFFGVGASWIYISIQDFSNSPAYVAYVITIGFVCILALFTAIPCALIQLIKLPKLSKYTLMFASFWTLCEWIRSYLFTGFPWLLLGHSQLKSPLAGFIPIVGTYGTSALVLCISGLAFYWIKSRKSWYWPAFFGLATIIMGGDLLEIKNWTYPSEDPLPVSLIQGGIPQAIKWSPDYLHESLQRYVEFTKPLVKHSDLIIWPESAIPLFDTQAKEFLQSLNQLLKADKSSLLVGIPIENKQNSSSFNGAIGLGELKGIYYKRHLVPFGEYVPFESLLRGLIGFFDLPMSDFIAGELNQPLFELRNHNLMLAIFICYEIAYSNLVRHDALNANILVTLTNDAWFGHSFALAQHLGIAQIQALQTGRPLLFVANTGITGIINYKGQVRTTLPLDKPAVLTTFIQPRTGQTPWLMIGDAPIIIILFLIALTGFYKGYRRKYNFLSKIKIKNKEIA